MLCLAAFAAPAVMARMQDTPPAKTEGAAPGAPDTAPAPADSPEAKMILEACGSAIKKARAITYQGHYHAVGGMLEGYMGTQTGLVQLLRAPGPDAAAAPDDPFLVHIVGADTDTKKVETRIEVALGRGTIEWRDDAAKKVMERPSRDIQARNKIIQSSTFLRNEEFLKPLPLADFKDATATLNGTETLDGVSCDVVLVARGKSKSERWSIASSDHFPRRIATIAAGNYGELVLDLSSVTVDTSGRPSLSPEQMRVGLPEGYSEDRRVGPPPAPTPPTSVSMTSQSKPKPNNEGTKPAPAAPAPPPAPAKPVMAPDFDLVVGRGANGESASGRVKLADLHGKVIVLDFFGTWTIPAPDWHTELDALAKAEEYKDVKFLALNVREKNPDAAVAYMDHEKHAPELLMNADKVAKDYMVHVYPATVVIGADGKVVEIVQGSRAGGDAKRLVKEAIDKALGRGGDAPHAADKTPIEPEPKGPK